MRTVKILVSRHWTVDGEDFSEIQNPDPPEELVTYAEQIRGNAQAKVAVTTDFGMKDFGNGPSGSVTISLECNQDDKSIYECFKTLSSWTVALAEQHFVAADQKFQQMYFQRHPEKAGFAPTGGPPPFTPA